MPKYHIWFWPFQTTDLEYEEHVHDLEHLYPDGRRVFRFVDAGVQTHPGWRSRIQSETRSAGTVVAIYVMGHTNINFPLLQSELDPTKGESVNAGALAIRINWIVSVIDQNAGFKVKFLNCRSAHARYPRPTCEALSLLCQRAFFGYAYALDICTRTKEEDSDRYKAYKEAFIQTSDTDVQAIRAKDARFEVWPTLQTQQADGTTLQNFLDALQSVGK